MSNDIEELQGRIEEYKRTILSQEREIDKLSSQVHVLGQYNDIHSRYMKMIDKLIGKVGYYE